MGIRNRRRIIIVYSNSSAVKSRARRPGCEGEQRPMGGSVHLPDDAISNSCSPGAD